jgi:hypothetical protein
LAKVFGYHFFYNLPIIIAMVMLGISPLMIILNENENANQIAGYAFYLIIVGVVFKIIQYLKNGSLHGVNQVDEMERQP